MAGITTASLVSAGVAAASAAAAGVAAKNRADEAKRVAKMNAELGSLDTKYSPFVSGQSVKQAVPDAGPGMFAGALSGGLGGLKAGVDINKSIKQLNAYDALKQNKQ